MIKYHISALNPSNVFRHLRHFKTHCLVKYCIILRQCIKIIKLWETQSDKEGKLVDWTI